MLCSDNQRVEDYADEDCDLTHNGLALICLVIAILTTSFTIIFALYHKYKFYINTLGYRYLPRWFFRDEEKKDKDKIHDVFVIYAKDDESFVTTRIVPMLENQYPYFKLCLHVRDWPIGGLINNQIHKSVMSSRRILVVLSHNFLDSEWCKLEFKIARDQAIKDRVNRLVVIMREHIATHRLNEDLKAYITKYTYIPWQDTDWFWSKLRYALPHKRRANTNTDRNGDRNEEQRQMFGMQQC